MDLDAYRHRATTTIDSPPEAVYDLLADVSRMAVRSPVCTGGRYDDDSREWFRMAPTPPPRPAPFSPPS